MTRAINAFDIEVPCHIEIKRCHDLAQVPTMHQNCTIRQQDCAQRIKNPRSKLRGIGAARQQTGSTQQAAGNASRKRFISTWQANTRNEAAASKAHFLDLCALLDVPPPHSDPTGSTYAFEKGVKKASGGGGWADVWKRGCFGWEYKSRGGDLEKAHEQLLRYAGALENPPLLITSDMDHIVVRTNWTNAVSERRDFILDDLRDPASRTLLRACWNDPDRWRPAVTRQALTEKAAGEFAELARRLRERGHDPKLVAHFINRLVFCLFADDVGLLPPRLLPD